MTDTALAPGYVRCTYDGFLFPHHMTIPVNVDPASPPGVMPDLILKDATTVDVETAIGDFWAVLQPFLHTSVGIGLAELHTVDAVSGFDQFIWAWNIGLAGLNVTPQVAASQLVWSFKTSVGSAYKLYLMEPSFPVNNRVLPPYTEPNALALSDFIVGNTSPVYGRQNAYPFVPVSMISKTNDKLRAQQGLA